MDKTSLIMGIVLVLIVAIPVILLAKGGRKKSEDATDDK
jgi:hypothetical protein